MIESPIPAKTPIKGPLSQKSTEENLRSEMKKSIQTENDGYYAIDRTTSNKIDQGKIDKLIDRKTYGGKKAQGKPIKTAGSKFLSDIKSDIKQKPMFLPSVPSKNMYGLKSNYNVQHSYDISYNPTSSMARTKADNEDFAPLKKSYTTNTLNQSFNLQSKRKTNNFY